jgi:hypothetical protein
LARYDQHHRYDSAVKFDAASSQPASTTNQKPKRMAQVKLELAQRDDNDLQAFAEAHIEAMKDNPNFPNPSPSAADFAAALAAFKADVAAAEVAEQAATAAIKKREASRAVLSQFFNDRASHVQTKSGGKEEMILTAGLGVRAQPLPVEPLPAPVDFMPTMGDAPGQIELTWSALRGARTYLIQYREHGTSGEWSQEIGTKSRFLVEGLTGGKTYVFRVAAVGAAGQSPWSLEAARMAP